MILVTGATGHIGNVLVRALLERGERVRALILPGEDRTPLDGLPQELEEGDVLDPQALERACAGVRQVYHLAGVISIMPGKNRLVHQVNVQGTQNMIRAAKKAGVSRLIYTSSIHAITRAPHGVVVDESLPFDPCNCAGEYDRSKAEASLAVLEAAHGDLDAVIACPTGVIGPFDFRLSEMGQYILNSIRSKYQVWVEGAAYDFVDVRDVVQGLILAGEKGRKAECYILSGERISLSRLARTAAEIAGNRVKGIHIPLPVARFVARLSPLYYRLAGARPQLTPYSLDTVVSNSVISHAKARRELGYAPRSIRISVADTIQWFRENRFLWAGRPDRA